jgi:hypothetical protein
LCSVEVVQFVLLSAQWSDKVLFPSHPPLSSHCLALTVVWWLPLHFSSTLFLAGMEVVKVGGPVYRIGVGGGAASSVQVSMNS